MIVSNSIAYWQRHHVANNCCWPTVVAQSLFSRNELATVRQDTKPATQPNMFVCRMT